MDLGKLLSDTIEAAQLVLDPDDLPMRVNSRLVDHGKPLRCGVGGESELGAEAIPVHRLSGDRLFEEKPELFDEAQRPG